MAQPDLVCDQGKFSKRRIFSFVIAYIHICSIAPPIFLTTKGSVSMGFHAFQGIF